MEETRAHVLYKKLYRIGKGSFGEVYKGVEIATGKSVAIKVLDLDTDDDEILDIQREISILSRCDSEYITRYRGAYLSGSKLWLILDYAGCGSMRNIMKAISLSETVISIICRQVLHALVYLHKQAGIIHRDIKAANILLTDDGRIQLCDFGVAGQITMNCLRRNSFVGTPYWISPEMIKRSQYDFKTDIWSLGITCIELATGNPPFSEYDPRQAILMISNSKPARLDGANFSSAIKEFVALCLKEDPEERPTAEELLKTRFIKLAPSGNGPIFELISNYKKWQAINDKEEPELVDDAEHEIDLVSDPENDWIFETIRQSLLPKSFPPIADSQDSSTSSRASPDSSPKGAELVNELMDSYVQETMKEKRMSIEWPSIRQSLLDDTVESKDNTIRMPKQASIDWKAIQQALGELELVESSKLNDEKADVTNQMEPNRPALMSEELASLTPDFKLTPISQSIEDHLPLLKESEHEQLVENNQKLNELQFADSVETPMVMHDVAKMTPNIQLLNQRKSLNQVQQSTQVVQASKVLRIVQDTINEDNLQHELMAQKMECLKVLDKFIRLANLL